MSSLLPPRGGRETVPNETRFSGPVFIVGMPRSGTKLLRELLNRSPEIGIPDKETHFIPLFIGRFGKTPDLERPEIFDEIFSAFTKTNFYWHMAREGRRLTGEQCKSLCRARLPAGTPLSWTVMLESLIRYYAPPGRSDGFVWGDKTPDYLSSIAILREVFPGSRFLHIIRDPRDYCLSVRKTWGKNLYRAAQRWCTSVAMARSHGQALGSDYLELRYEALLQDPSASLMAACQFLQCEFRPEMLSLASPSEEYGNARGAARIVRDNTGRFRKDLSPAKIRRIEEICYPVLSDLGIECEYATQERRLGTGLSGLFALADLMSLLRFYIADKGIGHGLQYVWRAYRERGRSHSGTSPSC